MRFAIDDSVVAITHIINPYITKVKDAALFIKEIRIKCCIYFGKRRTTLHAKSKCAQWATNKLIKEQFVSIAIGIHFIFYIGCKMNICCYKHYVVDVVFIYEF